MKQRKGKIDKQSVYKLLKERELLFQSWQFAEVPGTGLPNALRGLTRRDNRAYMPPSLES